MEISDSFEPSIGGLDHAWLYSSPSILDSLKWSDDNLIAVSSMQHVTIIEPGRLDGPRAIISLEADNKRKPPSTSSPSDPPIYVPIDAWRCGSLSRAVTQELLGPHDPGSRVIRGLQWSPLGVAQAVAVASTSHQVKATASDDPLASGCALSVITGDHKV